jgi:4-amino-4-deoxy-L-arabinose transferase-like glycosyltransferase
MNRSATLDRPLVEPAPRPQARRPWIQRFWRGREDDPAWARPALLGLLLVTGVLYVWDLGASGWANSFYTAAVEAGTKSWKASFFGSFDSSNFITVDKPPASLWVMELSGRLFGFNAWSMLVPQALEGVATVGVVYLTVRRWLPAAAGLAAGAVTALTPVAALMFRFNNPDALMVLLITLAAYATVRGIEDGRARWMVLAGGLVGFGFLAKELQALVVVPALAGAYLLAAPGRWWTRLRQLFYGGVALAAAAGWWIMAVQLTPAADRPYIGGSQNNSLWNVIFGYNGFGRLTGNETGSVGGGGGAAGNWGPTGLTRLFNTDFGTQVSWLLPAALILLGAGLAITWRAPRRNRLRAGLVLWGGWLLVTGLVFSLGRGIIHPYYSVALAPAIGGVVGTSGYLMWANRNRWTARAIMAISVAVTAVWSYILLDRTPHWLPWLRPLVLVVGLVAAAAILGLPWVGTRVRAVIASAAILAALAGPFAYTVDTVNTPHSGAIPSAGPVAAVGFGGPAGRGGFPRFPGGGQFGGPPPGFGGGLPIPGAGGAGPATGGRPGGAGGGLLNASHPSAALTALLAGDASKYKWVAATVGANDAAGYQLATGRAVMAIGGFNGTDPYPTLNEFEQLVRAGEVHYFIAGGTRGGQGAGSSSASAAITSWVESSFQSTTVSGVTVYDLTSPVSG